MGTVCPRRLKVSESGVVISGLISERRQWRTRENNAIPNGRGRHQLLITRVGPTSLKGC